MASKSIIFFFCIVFIFSKHEITINPTPTNPHSLSNKASCVLASNSLSLIRICCITPKKLSLLSKIKFLNKINIYVTFIKIKKNKK